MGRITLILGTLWVTASISLAYGYIDDNSDAELKAEKRQASNGPCAGIVCAQAPDYSCRKVDSYGGGINSCCSDFECRKPDGTVSRHSGIAGSGSKGYSTSYESPDGKGYRKGHSTSSFTSSSSNSNGPSAFNSFNFNGPTPPALPPSPFMGPPPGFNMPSMGFLKLPTPPPLPKGFGPPLGFGQGFGPPPGFFDPPVWMKFGQPKSK